MLACSSSYEQLIVFFSNPANMDCEDNHEEKQGVTSEINMGIDFNFKKGETEAKRLLLCRQNKQQISYLSTAPCGTGVAQKVCKLLNKIIKYQELLHTCPHSLWGFHFSSK